MVIRSFFKGHRASNRSFLEQTNFHSLSLNGFGLLKNANGYLRLPSGISPREARVRHLEIGPLHNFLEKGLSEPHRIGKLVRDNESELNLSQEDSLLDNRAITIPSRSRRQTCAGYDFPLRAIAWIGRAPVTISKLNRNLRKKSKSSSSAHPPEWKLWDRKLGLGGLEEQANAQCSSCRQRRAIQFSPSRNCASVASASRVLRSPFIKARKESMSPFSQEHHP
jgi:hypothetical protein